MTLAASLRTPWAGAWADAVPDPDAALLRRYAADRDAAAFAVLVRRHGPLVFGVCLRTAGHRADAEDAFQAVFLILAQKAGRVARPELLGNWLYGVAVRVGRKARRAARRRHHREAAMADVPRPTPADGWSDAAPVIDEELGRLADHYRSAVLLCDVQGLNRAEAAARLGIPEGTLSSRLNAGRKKLAERLSKRGVTLAVAGVGPLLAANATAAVPDELAGRLAAVLQHLSAGDPIGGPVGDLIREGFTVRTKLWAGLLAAGVGTGLTFAAWPGGDDKPKADPPATKKPDEPKADGKPAKPAKAKLINTIETNGPISSPEWSDSGALLYAVAKPTPDRGFSQAAVKTYMMHGYQTPGKRDGRGLGSPSFEFPAGGFLGFIGDDSYVVYSPARGRINAPDLIQFFEFGEPLERNARVARPRKDSPSVEIDVAEVGKPFAISPDGKAVFAEQEKTTGDDTSVTIRLLDPKTGDAVRTLGTFGGEALTVRGYKLSRAADRLFVYLHGPDYVTVECIDVTTGKSMWNVQYPNRPRPKSPDGRPIPPNTRLLSKSLVPSQDGKRLAVQLAKSEDGGEARVLDAATGKEVIELQGVPEGGSAVPLDFSHDGRLLVGKTSYPRDRNQRGGFGGGEGGGVPVGPLGGPAGQTGPDQLVVWDLKTGKVLRAWDDQLRVEVAFAPDRPVLAVVESERTVTGGGAARGFNPAGGDRGFGGRSGAVDPNAAAPTVTYRSTIGFWDLAPLVK